MNSRIIYFISVTLLLNGALAHAQLLFPVKSGWIESVTIKNPGACGWPGYATSIAVRQECAEVMAIEDGVHVTSFRVEGELYVLTRGKYFTAYGPLDTFYIPRLQKFQRGAVVGILNTTGKGPWTLDLSIVDQRRKSLRLDSVYPEQVKTQN